MLLKIRPWLFAVNCKYLITMSDSHKEQAYLIYFLRLTFLTWGHLKKN